MEKCLEYTMELPLPPNKGYYGIWEVMEDFMLEEVCDRPEHIMERGLRFEVVQWAKGYAPSDKFPLCGVIVENMRDTKEREYLWEHLSEELLVTYFRKVEEL